MQRRKEKRRANLSGQVMYLYSTNSLRAVKKLTREPSLGCEVDEVRRESLANVRITHVLVTIRAVWRVYIVVERSSSNERDRPYC